MQVIKAEIITIGDEILIGQIVDTNSAWMAPELNKIGVKVVQITSVADNATEIINSLDLALSRANIVLMTGGIGPTKDDITKTTLTRYFGTKLVFDKTVYENIETIFKNRPWVINELTKSQAMVPEDCTVIQNAVGTAPITWFEKDAKVIVSMPGVPMEMKNVMSTEILPRLQNRFKAPTILHRTVMVYGYPESALAIKIADWENALPEYIKLAYLPHMGIIKLRLSAILDDILTLNFAVNQQIDALSEVLGDAIISYEDLTLEQIIGQMLTEKNKTLATAESCTGGYIASKITLVPGSSNYYNGSMVAYSNEIKTKVLKVPADLIEKHGAVSAEVVEAMATGVRQLMHTDYAIATSGIAGPGGGTDDKPIGTVWVAVACDNQIVSRKFHFFGARTQVIERTALEAFLILRGIIAS